MVYSSSFLKVHERNAHCNKTRFLCSSLRTNDRVGVKYTSLKNPKCKKYNNIKCIVFIKLTFRLFLKIQTVKKRVGEKYTYASKIPKHKIRNTKTQNLRTSFNSLTNSDEGKEREAEK